MGSTPPALTSAAALFTFSRGECTHCAVPWIWPLTCAQVACSAVPALLWNSFHPCATPGILHRSGRPCLGQARWLSLGLDVGVATGVSLCMVLYAWSCLQVWPLLEVWRLLPPYCSFQNFLCQGVSIIQWLSKKGFWEEGWVSRLSFTVMLRERYGASGG